MIKNSPWKDEKELMQELERAWEEMKQIGLQQGILTLRDDGAIVGKSNPNKWFDAVEKEHAKSRN